MQKRDERVGEGADNVGLTVSAYLERQVEYTVILTEHYWPVEKKNLNMDFEVKLNTEH